MKTLYTLILTLTLAGCAVAPRFDPDLACYLATPNEAAAVQLMKSENVSLTGTHFIGGNKVTLLRNGGQTYPAMERDIAAAKMRIDMESYEFDGAAATQFSSLLLAKRAAGVQVDLIYDAWGSASEPKTLFEALRRGGVDVIEYNPFNPASILTLDANKRDHRKLLVVDGAVAYTGGINISQVYENRRADAPQTNNPQLLPWRDTDVRIEGPVVGSFEQMFLQTWAAQKGPSLPPPPSTPSNRPGNAVVQAIDGTVPGDHPAIYESLLTAIAAAHQSIHLTTGFFAPTPDLVTALQCAARRGVDVKIIVPSRSTSDSAITAGRSHYEDLLAAGVQLYEQQGSVLHAKTAVIDGVWSIVGSSNLDWRSVVFNNEIDAVIIGHGFGDQMEAMFQQDLFGSREIKLQAWRERGLGERLKELRARAIEALL